MSSYVAVGHVTVDLLEGGRRRAGGTVVFGALAAALRGSSASVLTVTGPDVDALLPFPARFDLVRPATAAGAPTTTFVNRGTDRDRVQHVEAVAPPVAVQPADPGDRGVVHLGPVAQEVGAEWVVEAAREATVVLTPQGLIREWPAGGGVVRHRLVSQTWVDAVGARPVVVVLGAGELVWMRDLGERAIAAGGGLVVTDGARPATVRWPGGEEEIAPTPADLADDTGAGDVFAAVVGIEIAAGSAPPDAVRTAHAAVPELLPRIHALLPVG